jgi:predicted ATPase/class 3 adenylate cyclase
LTPVATVPRGTVTFVFTDIEGSTRRWERDRAAMEAAVRRHDELMRAAVAAHDGHVFKTIGDAFCASFHRPQDAVAAAAAAQRALAAEDFRAVDGLAVRMATHTGTADERDGDYFGPAVNRVARILATGHGGQVLVSGVTADLSIAELPPHATLRDLGAHRLRDLERPEQIYQLVLRDLRADFPALRSLDQLPNNLPAQLTSFVGREDEVRTIVAHLGRHRIVTLVGSGGIGKTRASLQVAANLLDEYRDGVWLVELAPLTDAALLPAAIAAAMGIVLTGEDQLKALTSILREMRSLLVLDNCEHLIDAAALVTAAIVQRCPGVRVLASSRQPLGIDGELPHRLPSLGVPPAGAAVAIEDAPLHGAIVLFADRARVASQRFELSAANLASVADICRRLDGIPLAIELAAARVSVLSPAELSRRLDERFRLLAGGSRTALPRQQTLRALIDWSYDLLAEHERVLFDRLSVFVGACTLEAVTAICSDDRVDELDIVDMLASLVDKSLVVAEADDYTTRYRLLESMRAYAIERLRKRGESAEFARRHLSFYSMLARSVRDTFEESGREADLAPLIAELDNIRAAVDRSLEAGGDVAGGAGLASTVPWNIWDYREGIERLRPFAVLDFGDDACLAAQVQTAISPYLYAFGDHTAAVEASARGLAFARGCGKREVVFYALIQNARHMDPVGATLFDEAEVLLGARPPARMRRALLFAKAFALGSWGDHRASAMLYGEVLESERRLGNRGGEPLVVYNLAEAEHALGDSERAVALTIENLTLMESQRQYDAFIKVSAGLAGYLVALDRIGEAHEVAHKALRMRDDPEEIFVAMFVSHIGLGYAIDGDADRGVVLFAYATSVYARRGFVEETTDLITRKRLERLLEAMDPQHRKQLETRGAAMSLDEALAIAFPNASGERY